MVNGCAICVFRFSFFVFRFSFFVFRFSFFARWPTAQYAPPYDGCLLAGQARRQHGDHAALRFSDDERRR